MKKLTALLVALSLMACQSTQQPQKEPTGSWLWSNAQLEESWNKGETTREQNGHQFFIDKAKCEIEKLKIPIPSPSCTQAHKQDCSNLTGFAKGFCQGHSPQPQCDYSSVNAARKSQIVVFDSCLNVAGWVKRWENFADKNKKPKFGMTIGEIPQYLREQHEIKAGALVGVVTKGMAAYYADIKPNDILVAVDSQQVNGMEQALALLSAVNKNRSVLTVLRDNELKEIVVKL